MEADVKSTVARDSRSLPTEHVVCIQIFVGEEHWSGRGVEGE